MVSEFVVRALTFEDLFEGALEHFRRRQETTCVLYWNGQSFSYRDEQFSEDWDLVEKERRIERLRRCLLDGGWACGVFEERHLLGFANIQPVTFGSRGQYRELDMFHVSRHLRRQGWGRRLFRYSCEQARAVGTELLYISAHPAKETQLFYEAVGCVPASEVNADLLAKEPMDIQLEKPL